VECLRARRRLTRSNTQGQNQQDALKHYRDAWKALRLQIRTGELIPKDDGTEDRKFRPICLIDTLGKVLEHLIKA
jgi:hypothetical protein